MASIGPEVKVEGLFAELYLPETTFVETAERVSDRLAVMRHTLTEVQCDPRKTAMLRGVIQVDGSRITNTRQVDDEITHGHFAKRPLLAGHQGFGMLLAAGMHDRMMWWTGVDFIAFQSPAVPDDEMVATATVLSNDESGRVIEGNTKRGGSTHTRTGEVVLEDGEEDDFKGLYLPQNAWLEVGAHFGGGALTVLGGFPGDEYAPFYLGTGEVNLPKEHGRPGDKLVGEVSLTSIEDLEISGLGKLRVASVDVEIGKGSGNKWKFNELEFGFIKKDQLEDAIRNR